MQAITDRVLALDYTVLLEVPKVGAAVEPSISPLAQNSEAGVRQLALYCLTETGGPAALSALTDALLDSDAVVRGAAMRGLIRHAATLTAPLVTAILAAYDASDDPVVRGTAAIIVGRSAGAGPSVLSELKDRWKKETAPLAEEGCFVALSGLGDADAQKAFVARLLGASGRDRARLLEHAEALGGSWLLRPLGSVLDDLSHALRIGADGDPTVPEFLRGADLAVFLIATISGHTFSFGVDRQTNFSAAQLDEVRGFVARLPP